MKPSFKRRKYFIAPKFQLKYIGVMVSSVLASGILMSAGMYIMIYRIILRRLPDPEDQRLVIDVIFSDANKFLLVAFPVAILLMIVFAIFLSHKISGPEYRIRQILDDMKDGNLSGRTTLRDGDELQSIAGKLQEVNRNLSLLVKDQRKAFAAIKRTTLELQKESKKKEVNKAALTGKFNELNDELAELSESLEKFKVS